MNTRRTRLLAGLAALALTLTVATVLPDRRGHGRDDALAPRATTLLPTSQVGPSEITPEMRSEIDRVLAEGEYAARKPSARCATFEGQRYCLGLGWTTKTQREASARLAAYRSNPSAETTGDLDPLALARMSPRARTKKERQELEDAAASVAKVWVLRHEIQGVALPEDFAERHPEAFGQTTGKARRKPKTAEDYPRRDRILRKREARAQNKSYWCGPATMQAIAWGWQGKRKDQKKWAKVLGTSRAGTSITDLVRAVNKRTGWDEPERAGRYITLDISDLKYSEWYLLMIKHINDYRAPVILHPQLLKQFFPYLDDDASGHFQVGRAYDQDANGQKLLGFFEPWDQSRFDPTEPRIARKQWQSAYKMYRANQVHFQHNVGV